MEPYRRHSKSLRCKCLRRSANGQSYSAMDTKKQGCVTNFELIYLMLSKLKCLQRHCCCK
ncbi:hypothetical protein BIW11_09094 [Tropilaelaps mercedesae]|uniref:Uncharacterized protein n=1 Tax=Tropilaelaps mercedesae TaxID=418985 RepID=A0A1V9XM15_9ACAR|nr:hypothetical protein BIW11_09094 [Tropilaelaps mercedesae]